jgi:hypothetical protein
MPWWVRNGGLGNSEGLMVAFVLGAALTHLHGRRGWAFTLAIGAGLLRPEAWPFLGLYALWLLYEERARLRVDRGGLLCSRSLARPEWGSGNAFGRRTARRTQTPTAPRSPTTRAEGRRELVGMIPPPRSPRAAARGPVVLRPRRPGRPRPPARSLGSRLARVDRLVAVMTVRGFSGNQRYLVVPAAC